MVEHPLSVPQQQQQTVNKHNTTQEANGELVVRITNLLPSRVRKREGCMGSAMLPSLLSSSSHSFIHSFIPHSLFLIPGTLSDSIVVLTTANSFPSSARTLSLPSSAKDLHTLSPQLHSPAAPRLHRLMRQSTSSTSLPDTSTTKSACHSILVLSPSNSSRFCSWSTNSASPRSCSSSPNLSSILLMLRNLAQEPSDPHNQDLALSISPLSPSTLASAFSTSASFIPQVNVRQVPSILDLSVSTSIAAQSITRESADSNLSKPTASRQQHRDTPPTVSVSKSSTSLPGAKPLQFINNLAPVVPRPKPTPNSLYIQTQSAVQQKLRKQLREEGKIKRSSNCFIMYRTHIHPLLVARYGNQNNKEISRLAGRCWRNEPESVKSVYRQQAHQEKLKHASLYPAYKYTPSRSGQSSSSSSSSVTKDKDKAPVTSVNNAKYEKEEDMMSMVSSSTLSKEASTSPPPMKGQEGITESILQISFSTSAATSSNEQERSKKKRSNPDQSSSASKKFHVTETALHNFTGDTVPDLPVAKKTKGARPKQPVVIPGQASTPPVSIAGAVPNTFGYGFSFPSNNSASLSLDMDQTDVDDHQPLNSNTGWGADCMSASLTFNPLFLNGTIDSNDVWTPVYTSSPALTTPLLDLPLGTADFPWFQSPPSTTPTLELSSPLFSTTAGGPMSMKQTAVSSFPPVGFGTTMMPQAAMTNQIGNYMRDSATQSAQDITPNLRWGLESVSTLSAASPPMPGSYYDYASMCTVSNDPPFDLKSSVTDSTLGITNEYVQSHLSVQPQSSSTVDNCSSSWTPATSEQMLPITALPFVQQTWASSPLTSLPSTAINDLSSAEHSGQRGSSYTPITVRPVPTFQLLQRSVTSGNDHSSQLQHPFQQLQLQHSQQTPVSSPYSDLSHTTFQWTVPERHSSLVRSDRQLFFTDNTQKSSSSNLLLETIGSAGGGSVTTASAVMALALAANDHRPPQLVEMSSSTFPSTSFSGQTCQQQPPPPPLPPLQAPLKRQFSHDGDHSNGIDGDGDGESEEELSKSIEFYEKIVQQQRMRLSLQRQLKSTASGDLFQAQFKQQHG